MKFARVRRFIAVQYAIDIPHREDTFGPIEVPAERYWGAQTQRSMQNFRIGVERMPRPLIHALGLVKQAAALVNKDLGVLEPRLADAISAAAEVPARPAR